MQMGFSGLEMYSSFGSKRVLTNGLDYEEIYSPVVRFSLFRSLAALAVCNGMKVHQMVVFTAFLKW